VAGGFGPYRAAMSALWVKVILVNGETANCYISGELKSTARQMQNRFGSTSSRPSSAAMLIEEIDGDTCSVIPLNAIAQIKLVESTDSAIHAIEFR
jgi:hypothetical protein